MSGRHDPDRCAVPWRLAAFAAWCRGDPDRVHALSKAASVADPSDLEALAEVLRSLPSGPPVGPEARRRLSVLATDAALSAAITGAGPRTVSALLKERRLLASASLFGALSLAPYWGGVPMTSVADGVRVVSLGDAHVRFELGTPKMQAELRGLFALEPGTLAWISRMSRDDLLLDVGANIGLYGLAAAVGRSVRVVAVEPNPTNLATLRRNVAANPSAEVAIVPMALADRPGQRTLLAESEEASATGHIMSDLSTSGLDQDRGARLAVDCETLDRLIAAGIVPRPTRIKIDIDGGEVDALVGMSTCLADPRLHSLLIEVMTWAAEERVREFLGRFGFVGHRSDSAKNLIFVRSSS